MICQRQIKKEVPAKKGRFFAGSIDSSWVLERQLARISTQVTQKTTSTKNAPQDRPSCRDPGEPGGRVVGFVTSPPARRISGRGVVRWNGRSTLVPIPVVTKIFRMSQTAVSTVESKPPNGQNGDQDAG